MQLDARHAFRRVPFLAITHFLGIALEEATSQIVRNMHSIGLDLGKWINKGLLAFNAGRPTLFGLEMHLISIHRLVEELKPDAIIIDPISSLLSTGSVGEVKSMLVRLLDFLKTPNQDLGAFLTKIQGFWDTL